MAQSRKCFAKEERVLRTKKFLNSRNFILFFTISCKGMFQRKYFSSIK